MIKLTKIHSTLNTAPTLFLIPGGPGLSSLTLRSLDCLKRSFNLVYIDFPGTNDNPYTGKRSFEELSNLLAVEVEKIEGRKVILGHSFGGFCAADVFLKLNLDGLICLSTPFSKSALSAATENYNKNKTNDLSVAEKSWVENPSDKTFVSWLSEYGEMYFANTEGKNLLLNDKASAQLFLDNRSDATSKEGQLYALSERSAKKLFICGAEDKLLPPNILKSDAVCGGFLFDEINNASHFVSFDQPEKVARLIEEFVAT